MKKILIIGLSFWISSTLVSCNIPTQPKQQKTSEYILTVAAETVSVELTQRAPQISLTPALTLPPTMSLARTSTGLFTKVPTDGGGVYTSTPAPCNMAKFLTDVTYPDDTEVQSGSTFIKTWLIRNVGTCSWTSDYRLIYYQGERMGAPENVPLTGGTVKPGDSVEVSVSLKAPTYSGTFQTSFLLRSPDGVIFGVGQHGDQEIYLRIIVTVPTSTPTITLTPSVTSTNTPQSTMTALPDLQVTTFLIAPDTPVQGQAVNVQITVENNGNAIAGAFKVKWWPADIFTDYACIWNITSMNPGASQDLQCNYPGYPDSYNSINTKVFVDADNNIIENDESNNVLLMNIKVLKP